MSRILTTYNRPSISDLIRCAPDVDSLAKLRAQIYDRYTAGKIEAQERTVRDWSEAIFQRLCELARSAPTAGAATYVYNATFRWYSNDIIRAALQDVVQRRCAAL